MPPIVIRIENISKSFGKMPALERLSAVFEAGQAVALIGPNGSGKTTLIKCLLGMVVPDEGQILFDGKSIANDWQYRSQIGYMPQIGRYPDNMKISELFEMLKEIRQPAPAQYDEELIDAFGLRQILDKPMRTLSGGTRQKVSACLAFLFDPAVLILDEPTAGLDPLSAELLKEKIAREIARGKLLLITSHILSDLDELATHVMYLCEGKMEFYQSLESLKGATGEQKLGKAIAAVMQAQFKKTAGGKKCPFDHLLTI